MQIINDLEPCRRGVYSGVYGYYDFEGQLNSAIAIRTMSRYILRPFLFTRVRVLKLRWFPRRYDLGRNRSPTLNKLLNRPES